MTIITYAAGHYRRLADERLGKLAAIARIGAEPPGAVLAIIAGKEPGDAISHDYVTELRRELVKAAQSYRKVSTEYFTGMQGRKRDEVTDAERDAYMGTLMACTYSYVLAAILRVAEEDLGTQSARRLASVAGDMLEDGDSGDLNADVKPGAPLPPPSPAEQAEAGQLALGQPEPVVAVE